MARPSVRLPFTNSAKLVTVATSSADSMGFARCV